MIEKTHAATSITLNTGTVGQQPSYTRMSMPTTMLRGVILALSVLLLFEGCDSPLDADTPRRRISEPTKYFLKTVHLSEYDEGFDVQQLPDSGFVFVGKAWMPHTASIDVLLVRTDAEGNVLWKKSFGGVYPDMGHAVRHTSDDGFIIVGNTESYTNGLNDLWVIKTDASGTMQWNRSFGGPGYDGGHDVQECASGGYIVAGYTDHPITGGRYAWLLRIDESGNEIWSRRYGGYERDGASAVIEAEDGSFIVAGSSASTGDGASAIWVFKTGPNGDLNWERMVKGEHSSFGNSLCILPDGSIGVIGYSIPQAGWSTNMLFVRLDWQGDMFSAVIVHENAFGMDIEVTDDGNLIVCGFTNPYSDASDIVLSKLSPDGVEIWKRIIGGSRLDRAMGVITTHDVGYMVTGSTKSFGHGDQDLLILKTDDLGYYE